MHLNNQQLANDNEIGEILLFFWSQKKRIALVASAIFAFLVLCIIIQSPKYKATASIVLQRHELNLPDFNEVAAVDKFSDFSAQTETKILKSTELALNTIKATDYITKTDSKSADAALNKFSQSLSVVAQPSSKILDISFESEDPELSAFVANSVIGEYLILQSKNKNSELSSLKIWFHDKVEDLKNNVISKSKAVEDYRIKEGISLEEVTTEITPHDQQDLLARLSALQLKKIELDTKIDTIQLAIKSNDTSSILTSVINPETAPEIAQMRVQSITVHEELLSLKSRYGDRHPKVVQARNTLSQIEKAINQGIIKLEKSLKSENEAVSNEIGLTLSRVNQLQKIGDTQQAKLIQLKTLIYERDASQKQLDSFLSSYESIQSQINFPQPDASIASKAVIPASPDTPSKIILIFLSLIFSFGVSSALIVMMEILDPKISNFNDIRKFSVQPLGVIGELGNSARVNGTSLERFISKIYISAIADLKIKSLLITSALPKEGRTSFVLSLGEYLSSIGLKILIIDADPLKPDLTKICLSGEDIQSYQLDSRILRLQKFDLLPSIKDRSKVEKGFDLEYFDASFNMLRDTYDMIIIDTGPIISNGIPQALCRRVEGVLAIVSWNKTRKRNFRNMVQNLKSNDAPLIGSILNRIDLEIYKNSSSRDDFLIAKE